MHAAKCWPALCVGGGVERLTGIRAFRESPFRVEYSTGKPTWVCTQLRCFLLLLLLLLLLQGTAVLKGNFDIKSLELVLSTLQVGIGFYTMLL
jgi:hypothetical protein